MADVTEDRAPTRRFAIADATVAASGRTPRSAPPVRVLIVAHETTATPRLIEAVEARAARGPCAFTFLVPRSAHGLHRLVDPEDQEIDEAQAILDQALPLLEHAIGTPVVGMVGDPTPLSAVEDAVIAHGFDEIIVYTRPARVARLFRLDLPSKVTGLGLPTTTVVP